MNQPNGRADRLAVPLAALLACAALPLRAIERDALRPRRHRDRIRERRAEPRDAHGRRQPVRVAVGLKGVEDLGGGYATIFKLEDGFNAASGALSNSSALFGREAWVGITGPFGGVQFGELYTILHTTLVTYSLPGLGALAWGNATNNFVGPAFLRVRNSMRYVAAPCGLHAARDGRPRHQRRGRAAVDARRYVRRGTQLRARRPVGRRRHHAAEVQPGGGVRARRHGWPRTATTRSARFRTISAS